MSDATNNNALNAINPLSYMGVNPRTPPNFVQHTFAPTLYDSKNFQIGALWLNTGNAIPPVTPPTLNDLYVLVALYQGQATWLPFTAGDLRFLTGNSGGPVPPTANNINVVGDGTTVTVVGTPGTSTLTVSVVGTGVLSTLTGDTGGPVSPLAGNINILGTINNITVTGNPGTHTLTLNTGSAVATSYITNPVTGTAVPAAGVLTFAGTGDVTVSAAGSTVTINGSGSGTITTLHSQDGNNVTPTAGVINVSGAEGITTTGTVGPNTLTIHPGAASVAFEAYVSADINNVTGAGAIYTILFDTEAYDVGSNYNPATGVFTAPATGLYQFNYGIGLSGITAAANTANTVLKTTAASYQYEMGAIGVYRDSGNTISAAVSVAIRLTAGDTAHVTIAVDGEAGNVIDIDQTTFTEGRSNYFMCYRVA